MPEAARTRNRKIRVMIADDHTILREGLRKLVDEDPEMEVVGEAPDGNAAIDAAEHIRPDILLLDLAMPGLNGIATARKVRSATPETRILMLTVHQEEEYVSNALKAGAAGYVLKDAPAEELLEAIRRAHQGEIYLSAEVSKLVVEGRRGPRRAGRTVSQDLTNREREVCQHLAGGRSVPDIATLLGISRKTVDVHKTRLMKKLDIHNRAGLVKYAIQNRMIHV